MKKIKSTVLIYKTKSGFHVDVKLEKDTVWLTQDQISLLFGTQRPAITKHLANIFKEGELSKDSVCSKMERTADDGKIYNTQFYNLDAVISVGYRVNSKRATEFRIWATKTLKQYLLKGYAINNKKFLDSKEKLDELQNAISFLQQKSRNKLLKGQEIEILNILNSYSKTVKLLEDYDNNKLKTSKKYKSKTVVNYEEIIEVIKTFKSDLQTKNLASNLFGVENGDKLKAVIGNIYQTFGGKELYNSIEEKSAHLLYFIIKDHPFVDGNKRIGSLLFIYFLDKCNFLYKQSGEKKINDNALTALALLIAASNPTEKDQLIKIVTNLIS